ncbi:hypothetical protein EMIT0196MI5_120091 [Pseudomonas sp. IT-196MI5]
MQVRMSVEGSQGHLATAKLKLVERGVDDLPVQFKGLPGRHLRNQMEQGSDGAAGREHGDFLGVVGLVEDAVQACLDPLDKAQPAFQARCIVGAGQPAFDDQGEDTLELTTVLRGVAQDVQGFGFVRQHGRQQRADHRIGVELVEGGIGFQERHRQAYRGELFQRAVGRVLLAAQVARQATVEADAEFGQVPAKDFSLSNAGRRQDVVVVRTKRGLAMSNQIDAAHVRVIPVR